MKKDAENLSHMVPIRSILAAKYDISHLTKLISLVFQQAGPFYETVKKKDTAQLDSTLTPSKLLAEGQPAHCSQAHL